MALRDISNFKHLQVSQSVNAPCHSNLPPFAFFRTISRELIYYVYLLLLQEMREEEAAKAASDQASNIRTNASTEVVIKEFQRQKRVSCV